MTSKSQIEILIVNVVEGKNNYLVFLSLKNVKGPYSLTVDDQVVEKGNELLGILVKKNNGSRSITVRDSRNYLAYDVITSNRVALYVKRYGTMKTE